MNNKNHTREIIHYSCGSYYFGHIGGVPRYDYQISLAFPDYKHFTAPQQKRVMLEYLKRCKNPLVITDNISSRIVRLPLWPTINTDKVLKAVYELLA